MPLLRRIANEVGVVVDIRVRSNVGGHPRVVAEFELYQTLVRKGVMNAPDVLVIATDANCLGQKRRKEIQDVVKSQVWAHVVLACPDPHVERWYMADGDAFHEAVGSRPSLGKKKKCNRDEYKRRLVSAISKADQIAPLGGIEFATDIIANMNQYRAGKADASLKRLWQDLKTSLGSFA